MKKLLVIGFCYLLFPIIIFGQSFTFHVPQQFIRANPGDFVQFDNELINNSTSDLSFRVIRTLNNLPTANWSSSICIGDSLTGLCYPPFTDTTLVHMVLGDSSELILLDVNTDPSVTGTAGITLRIENVSNPQEFEEATFEVSTEPTAISPVDEPISGKFRLRPNYPNPFNPLTHIPLEVGGTNPVNVRLTVYNMLGQKVITLADKKLAPGTYEVTWDGRNSLGRSVSSGIYFYEMIAGSQRFIRKMFLIR